MKAFYRITLLIFGAIYLLEFPESFINVATIEGFVLAACFIMAVLSAFNRKALHWAIGYASAIVFSGILMFGLGESYMGIKNTSVTYIFSFIGIRIEGINGLLLQAIPVFMLLLASVYCLVKDTLSEWRNPPQAESPDEHKTDPLFAAPGLPIKINQPNKNR